MLWIAIAGLALVITAAVWLIQTRNSAVPGAYSAPFPSRLVAFVLTLGLALTVLATANIGLTGFRQSLRAQIALSLESIVNSSHLSVRSWLAAQIAVLHQMTADDDVRQLLLDRTDAAHRQAVQQKLTRSVEENRSLGYLLLDADGDYLLSSKVAVAGQPSELQRQQPEMLQAVLDGHSRFVPPLVISWLDGREQQVMFLLAPVRHPDGRIVAILAEMFDPQLHFSELLSAGQFGATGETFLLNSAGQLISPSRFEAEMRGRGTLRPGQSSILAVSAILPSEAISLEGYSQGSETFLQRNYGERLNGFRSYRDRNVLGVWVWDREYNFGVMTEVDTREAYAPVVFTRQWTFLLIALSALLFAGATLLLLSLAHVWQRRLSENIRQLSTQLNSRTDEVRHQQQQLNASDADIAFLRQILDEAPQYALWLDIESGQIEFMNQFASRHLNSAAAERLTRLTAVDEQDALLPLLSALRARPDQISLELTLADGRQAILDMTRWVRTVNERDKLVIFAQDHTHTTEQARTINLLEEEKQQAVDDLRLTHNRFLRQLAQPMNKINQSLQHLHAESLGERGRRLVRDIENSVRMIFHLFPTLPDQLVKTSRTFAKAVPSVSAASDKVPEHTGALLLVEDNDINQEVILGVLAPYSIKCFVTPDGQQALEFLKSHPAAGRIRLILMDWQMPIMDGLDTTRQIRAGAAGDAFRAIPIIAVTANAMASDRDACLQAGMDAFLPKPINAVQLMEKIAQYWPEVSTVAGTAPAVRPQALLWPNDLQAFDSRQLTDFSHNTEAFLSALMMFKHGAEVFEAELQRPVSMNELERLKAELHNFRGLAGNLGFNRFSQTCGQAEAQLQELNNIDLATLADIKIQLRQCRQDAEAILALNLKLDRADPASYERLKDELIQQLERDAAPDASDLGSFLQQAKSHINEKKWLLLARALQSFEYETALSLLKTPSSD